MPPAPVPKLNQVIQFDTHECIECGTILPAGKFPRWGVDNRCIYCLAVKNAENKNTLIRDNALKAYQAILRDTGSGPKAPSVETLINELLGKMGGLERFVTQWIIDLAEARSQERNIKAVLDHNMAIAKLIMKVSEMRQERELATISDEDLAQEAFHLVMEHLLAGKLDQAKTDLLKEVVPHLALEAEGILHAENAAAEADAGGAADAGCGGIEGISPSPTPAPVLPE